MPELNTQSLEDFLKSIERQAYRIALFGSGREEDAHDLVQESMLRFVTHYAKKPQQERKALFYRILHNQIKDLHRKRTLRERCFGWLTAEEPAEDPLHSLADQNEPGAEYALQLSGTFAELERALKQISFRQQQAFLLRAWEGLSVAETALVMKCSQGSVKTHYARALEYLRNKLGGHWP